MSEPTPTELWDAQRLQEAFFAHRQARGPYRALPPKWKPFEPWVKLVRKAHLLGVFGGDSMLSSLLAANDDNVLMPWELHRLMDSQAFSLASGVNSLQPGEADEMRELGMNPDDPSQLQQFRVRDYIKGALRKITGVAETTDTNSGIFIHYLVNDITATPPWLRYLLGWRHVEVRRECMGEAVAYFKEKRHIARACIALGFPKEAIAPDFEP